MSFDLSLDDLLEKHPLNAKEPAEIYKFIKVSGQYRFCPLLLPHGSLLRNKEETVEAAGTFRLAGDYWTMTDWQSSSLGIHCGPFEVEELSQLFGRPEKKLF